MFLTGVVVGTVMGAAVCLAAAVVHALAGEPEAMALRPALVPLHASSVTLISLN